jgi:hypothetical protein
MGEWGGQPTDLEPEMNSSFSKAKRINRSRVFLAGGDRGGGIGARYIIAKSLYCPVLGGENNTSIRARGCDLATNWIFAGVRY